MTLRPALFIDLIIAAVTSAAELAAVLEPSMSFRSTETDEPSMITLTLSMVGCTASVL